MVYTLVGLYCLEQHKKQTESALLIGFYVLYTFSFCGTEAVDAMQKFKVGLFVGRFQPLHRGHMHALGFAGASCEKLIVAVGSAQESGTEKNPLPARVRMKIIRTAIRNSKINEKVIRFVMVPDFGNGDAWFNYIIRRVPKIDVVFSGDPDTKRIFRSHKITVVTPAWHKRHRFSATKVRHRIRKGGRWHGLVPKSVVKHIGAHESKFKSWKII